MNICLITGIFPPDIGGPATYVNRLARALRDKGHKVAVVTLGDEASKTPFPVWRVSRRLPLAVRLLKLFLILLREGRDADVWYINGLELPAVLAGKFLRKRLVMKVVGDYAWERAMNTHMTGDSIDEFQQTPQVGKVEFHKKLRAWCARQVDLIITPSRYLKKLVCGWGVPAERVRVVYNAIEELPDTLETRSDVRKKLGFAADDILLITVGRLVNWKGIEGLLRVMAQCDDSFKLLIVGDGPEKNTLTESVKALGLSARVNLLGKAEREHVLSYIRASDLFVLNTAYEGFSHVLLEAMMVGTPVITTAVCGNPELVRHQRNGLLIAPGNAEELQQQIVNMSTDKALQRQCREGGWAIVRQFPWEQLLRETMRVLTTA